jgi:membrane carboxypeptidase/penicillin-binding protein PbpC
MGITTLNKPASFYGLPLVLGGGEVKLVDLVSAYGVFATEGLRYPLVSVLKIEDSEGNIIEENKKSPRRVLTPEAARLINDILSDNNARAPMFGYNSVLYFKDYDVAVKTGTTSDFKDGWTIGYTPYIVVGVWAGNNNGEPMWGEPGATVAGHIWRKMMEKIVYSRPKEYFSKPESSSLNNNEGE